MKHKVQKYLLDIRNSIDAIVEFSQPIHNLEEYKTSKLIKRAVEREFEIIGEAMNKLLKEDTSIVITNARKIISLRNWVIHSYDSVDDAIIWGIIQYNLLPLKQEVNALLDQNS